MPKIGIIGGSGLYNIEGLESIKRIKVDTPFGMPSDNYLTGRLNDCEVVFLPRHGTGHAISPSEINYRANIYGFKKLGASTIIAVSACGSLKEEIKPLDFILPDQFVDRTHTNRNTTFFTKGIVAHISLADPVCSGLAEIIYKSAKKLGISIHKGGTYLNMEGPAFSTRAESELYRKWGMDIIGMTNISEAKLAREAEICFVTLAAVTDYDCWHIEDEPVTVEMIINNLNQNVENAKKIIKEALPYINESQTHTCQCREALKYAIITKKDAIPQKIKNDLSIIIGKYIS